MKKCTSCGVLKDRNEYYHGQGKCKPCKKVIDKAWHENKAIKLEQAKLRLTAETRFNLPSKSSSSTIQAK